MSRGDDDPVTVFLGDLSRDVSKEEVEKTFSYYGKLKSIWLSRSPSGFGFVEFDDYHDALDAVKALDGKMICGSRVRVEFSRGRGRSSRGGRGRQRSGSRSPRTRKPFSPHDICYECGDRGHYAYDCEIRLRRQRRLKSKSRSRSRRRSIDRYSSPRENNRREQNQSDKNQSRHGRRRSPSHSRSCSSSDSDGSISSRERRTRSRTKSQS